MIATFFLDLLLFSYMIDYTFCSSQLLYATKSITIDMVSKDEDPDIDIDNSITPSHNQFYKDSL